MSKISNKWIVFLFFFGLILFTESCQKPADDFREDLVGKWTCSEKSSLNASSNYAVTITKSSLEENKIIINNLYNLSKNVDVNLTGMILSIPLQDIDGWDISGSGTISSGYKTMNLKFTADDKSGTPDQVTASLTKQ